MTQNSTLRGNITWFAAAVLIVFLALVTLVQFMNEIQFKKCQRCGLIILGRVLTEYIEQKGRWPEQVEDLHEISYRAGMFVWPDDAQEIDECVQLRFEPRIDLTKSDTKIRDEVSSSLFVLPNSTGLEYEEEFGRIATQLKAAAQNNNLKTTN